MHYARKPPPCWQLLAIKIMSNPCPQFIYTWNGSIKLKASNHFLSLDTGEISRKLWHIPQSTKCRKFVFYHRSAEILLYFCCIYIKPICSNVFWNSPFFFISLTPQNFLICFIKGQQWQHGKWPDLLCRFNLNKAVIWKMLALILDLFLLKSRFVRPKNA